MSVLESFSLKGNQGDEPSIQAVRDELLRRSGRLDVLVNNAVARPMQTRWMDDAARFDESMHVNATGLFMVTRAFGEIMEKQRSGSIINISPGGSRRPPQPAPNACRRAGLAAEPKGRAVVAALDWRKQQGSDYSQ